MAYLVRDAGKSAHVRVSAAQEVTVRAGANSGTAGPGRAFELTLEAAATPRLLELTFEPAVPVTLEVIP